MFDRVRSPELFFTSKMNPEQEKPITSQRDSIENDDTGREKPSVESILLMLLLPIQRIVVPSKGMILMVGSTGP